jgi:hypothetical protein
MLMLVTVLALPSALVGFIVGRWPAAFVAPGIWALYILGLTRHWWGYGVGDGWQFALVVGAAAAAVGAATGVLARRARYRMRHQVTSP